MNIEPWSLNSAKVWGGPLFFCEIESGEPVAQEASQLHSLYKKSGCCLNFKWL